MRRDLYEVMIPEGQQKLFLHLGGSRLVTIVRLNFGIYFQVTEATSCP